MKLGACTAVRADLLRAPEKADPNMAGSVEHEDRELDQPDRLRHAARTLVEVPGRAT